MGFLKPVLGDVIGGVGNIGGAIIQSRAQNKKTDAESKATAEALAYTKQKDAQSRADNERAYQVYQQQYNAWNKMRNAALSKYGFSGSMPDMAMGQPSDMNGIGGAPAGGFSVGGQAPPAISMAGGGGDMGTSAPGVPGRTSLADILQSKGRGGPEDAFDWQRMGLA